MSIEVDVARGRKRKGDALKLLTGSRTLTAAKLRKRKKSGAASSQFDLPAATPNCPTWLDEYARDFWAQLAPELGAVLCIVDWAKFAVLCQALADVRRNVEIIRARDEGEDLELPSGAVISHPAVGRKNKAMGIVAKLGSDFGLDPASRSRLTLPTEKTKPDEAEQEFFGTGPQMRIAQ